MFYLGIIALLTVLGLSLIITRVATVALALTGLAYETARFQARSAFTGTGFTTREAEDVVNHPVRRHIIMILMILRSAGLVTIIVSLILSFLDTPSHQHAVYRLLWIIGGISILWLIAMSRWIERYMQIIIGSALKRWTSVEIRDYAALLNLSGNYSVTELNIEEDDWLAEKQLKDCHLRQEGVIILGIIRDDGSYVGAPKAETMVHPGDTLIMYGRSDALSELDKRRADAEGDQAHIDAEVEQQQHLREQEEQEERYWHKRKGEGK